jgi:hypothetical protein
MLTRFTSVLLQSKTPLRRNRCTFQLSWQDFLNIKSKSQQMVKRPIQQHIWKRLLHRCTRFRHSNYFLCPISHELAGLMVVFAFWRFNALIKGDLPISWPPHGTGCGVSYASSTDLFRSCEFTSSFSFRAQSSVHSKKKKLRGLSPRANYTERPTAAFRQS